MPQVLFPLLALVPRKEKEISNDVVTEIGAPLLGGEGHDEQGLEAGGQSSPQLQTADQAGGLVAGSPGDMPSL